MTHTERPQPSADPGGPGLWAVHPLVLALCLGHCRCSRTLGTRATARRKCAIPFFDTWRMSLGKWPVLRKPRVTGLWRLL